MRSSILKLTNHDLACKASSSITIIEDKTTDNKLDAIEAKQDHIVDEQTA